MQLHSTIAFCFGLPSGEVDLPPNKLKLAPDEWPGPGGSGPEHHPIQRRWFGYIKKTLKKKHMFFDGRTNDLLVK